MTRNFVAALLAVSMGALAAQPPGHPPINQPGAQAPGAVAEPKPADVASVDAIVGAFYAASSGEPDKPRDWDRLHSLFVADGRYCAARPGTEGVAGVLIMPVTDYIEFNRKYFEKGGFVEREIARRVDTFGNMAHVWSTYESRRRAADDAPYARGIYSIQLLRSGNRWSIVNVYWDFERPDNPIPETYLRTPAP